MLLAMDEHSTAKAVQDWADFLARKTRIRRIEALMDNGAPDRAVEWARAEAELDAREKPTRKSVQ